MKVHVHIRTELYGTTSTCLDVPVRFEKAETGMLWECQAVSCATSNIQCRPQTQLFLQQLPVFSCPSSSIPTFVIHSFIDWLINVLEFSFKMLTKPYQTFTNRTRFHNSDQISQFWPKFQKSNQISEFLPNITVLCK